MVAAQAPAAREFYQQGVQALNERRFTEARQLLQKAVEADPAFAGAWLDLALATFGDGDYVQAEEFLSILEQRFTVPQNIAEGVAALRTRIQAQAPAAGEGWQWRRTVQAGTGYDTNANAGLSLSDLTLTFPGGGITLPLAQGFRPRADGYALAGLAVEGARRVGTGQVEAAASLKSRANFHVHDFDTLEAQASLAWVGGGPLMPGVLPGPWRASATLQRYYLGGSPLFNSLAFTGVHAWAGVRCRPQATAELDVRRFPVAANLDSHVFWLGGQGACPSPLPGADALSLQARAGYEVARYEFASARGRPGGNTHHTEITVSQPWTWSGANGNHRLEALVQWVQARDTEGYSPLLADNARRRVSRGTVGVAYTWPLQPQQAEGGWQATLTAQAFRQRSNLEIFRLKGETLQLSVQRPW